MGHVTVLYGYIYGCDYEKNTRAIAALPEENDWPYLTRDMFSIPDKAHNYGDKLITFGLVYNGVERAWDKWLAKLETLRLPFQPIAGGRLAAVVAVLGQACTWLLHLRRQRRDPLVQGSILGFACGDFFCWRHASALHLLRKSG